MKVFRDKVAVITGAASGIGFGFAQRCVQEGMKVVLADVEQEALGPGPGGNCRPWEDGPWRSRPMSPR